MSQAKKPMVFAPFGKVNFTWSNNSNQTTEYGIKYRERKHRERLDRAAVYWDQQEMDGCHYTFSEYERYLSHGIWSKLSQDRALFIKQQQQKYEDYLIEQQKAKQEAAREQQLMELILDSHYLEEPDDYSEVDSEDEGWVSDDGVGSDGDYY
jgi:hypothetical protein